MTGSGQLLGDTTDRSYAEKLDLFARFAEPELRRLLARLPIEKASSVLDAGCGTGRLTGWLADLAGPEGRVTGVDLATAHLQTARRHASGNPSILLVQADLLELPFPAHHFDGAWSGNTVNHLRDPVRGLREVARTVRPGGWVAVGQSHFLPEMVFAWDERLERAVTDACRKYYRRKYDLDEHALTGTRRLSGIAKEAGLRGVRVRTVVIERVSPLSPLDMRYFQTVLFEGAWGSRVEPSLSPEDRATLRRLCDPAGSDYCLRRPDFHAIQTFTIATGRVPGRRHRPRRSGPAGP